MISIPPKFCRRKHPNTYCTRHETLNIKIPSVISHDIRPGVQISLRFQRLITVLINWSSKAHFLTTKNMQTTTTTKKTCQLGCIVMSVLISVQVLIYCGIKCSTECTWKSSLEERALESSINKVVAYTYICKG